MSINFLSNTLDSLVAETDFYLPLDCLSLSKHALGRQQVGSLTKLILLQKQNYLCIFGQSLCLPVMEGAAPVPGALFYLSKSQFITQIEGSHSKEDIFLLLILSGLLRKWLINLISVNCEIRGKHYSWSWVKVRGHFH